MVLQSKAGTAMGRIRRPLTPTTLIRRCQDVLRHATLHHVAITHIRVTDCTDSVSSFNGELISTTTTILPPYGTSSHTALSTCQDCSWSRLPQAGSD